MISAVLSAAIVIAIAAPIVAALVGMRLRWSIAISLTPGAVLVAAVLTLMAGVMGVCIASVVTRVRRGNGWSRGA